MASCAPTGRRDAFEDPRCCKVLHGAEKQLEAIWAVLELRVRNLVDTQVRHPKAGACHVCCAARERAHGSPRWVGASSRELEGLGLFHTAARRRRPGSLDRGPEGPRHSSSTARVCTGGVA